MLLFLTGEEEIEDACRRLRIQAQDMQAQSDAIGPLQCIPMYASLSLEGLQRVFDPVPQGKPGSPPAAGRWRAACDACALAGA